jgi:hypothetical protein
MTPVELVVAGALGVAGLALVGAGGYIARRRRLASEARRAQDAPARRIRVELEEDPIVAALGVGTEAGPRRRP